MFRKLKIKNIYLFMGILLVILLSLIIFLTGFRYYKQDSRAQELPLLLNSGLFDCQQATIKYILWTEENRELPPIEEILESSGLAWDKQVLSDFSGRNAYKYINETIIRKEDESQAFAFYHKLCERTSGHKVKVYFEEKIDAALDPNSYMEKNKAKIVEIIRLPGTISLSALHNGLPWTVIAGEENINLQLVTKSEAGPNCGKTVLAFPALLEEF
jgi:hypothetical protein